MKFTCLLILFCKLFACLYLTKEVNAVENKILKNTEYMPSLYFQIEPNNVYIVESISVSTQNRYINALNNNNKNSTTSITIDCLAKSSSSQSPNSNKLNSDGKNYEEDLKVKWFKDNVDLDVEQYSSDFNDEFEKK